ncbi:MAG TPA: hypothetical protein V6C65_21280, partial [Allocoleopsis sp.]
LISSAVKNIDTATTTAVQEFAADTLKPGIALSTIATGGVGLAPFHDWDSKIPQTCKDKVKAAEAAIQADPKTTGVQ